MTNHPHTTRPREGLDDPLTLRGVLRLRDVVRITGRSRSAIYAALDTSSRYHEPEFPRQIRLSERGVGWRASEVLAYVDALPRKGGDHV